MSTVNTIEPQIEYREQTQTFRDKSVSIEENGVSFYFKTTQKVQDGIENSVNLRLKVNKIPNNQKLDYSWIEECFSPPYTENITVKVLGPSLTTHSKSRNDNICKKLRKHYDIKISEIEDFLDELGLYMETHEEGLFTVPENDEQAPEFQESIQKFEDYPEYIQGMANEIVNNGKALKTFLTVIGRAHEGDKKEAEILVHQTLTNRVRNANQVHTDMGGFTDTGKTKLVRTVLKIVPRRFVTEINSFSPKYLYHTDELRDDHNYILVDDYADVGDNDVLLGLLKDLTDTTKDVITHRTLIDGKPVVLVVAGKNIFFLTAARDISDAELQRRCLKLNPDESGEHKKRVKDYIIEEEIAEDPEIDNAFLLCQAVFDKLTEKEFSVFNPFLKLIDTENLGNTDIKMFSAFVKARAILFQKHRVEIADGVLLGTKEDVEIIQKLWNSIGFLQKYKLTKAKVKLLQDLKVFNEDAYNSYIATDAEERPKKDNVKGDTYKELAKNYGVAKSSVVNWIKTYSNKHESNPKPSLEDLGFVITKSSNPNSDNAEIWVYLDPDKEDEVKSWKIKKDVNIDTKNRFCLPINGFLGKLGIIRNFLRATINLGICVEQIEKNPKIENLPKEVKTDKEVEEILHTVNEVVKGFSKSEFMDEDERTKKYLNTLLEFDSRSEISTITSPIDKPEPNDRTDEEFSNNSHIERDEEEHINSAWENLDYDVKLSVVNAPENLETLKHELNHLETAILRRLIQFSGDTVGNLKLDWASYHGYPINQVEDSITKLIDKGIIKRL